MTERLALTSIPYPAGPAVVITSRPGPRDWWTVTISAPGLDCDGEHHTVRLGPDALKVHRACCDTVHRYLENR